jgi:hypothetical protein
MWLNQESRHVSEATLTEAASVKIFYRHNVDALSVTTAT